MDANAKQIIKQGDNLFSKKVTLNSLHQEIADNFYVERADFTRVRTLGEDMASHLLTSYPMMIRRDLQNAVSTMLRPTNQIWGSIHTAREDLETNETKRWLEFARDIQWRAMYDRRSQFVKSTKEADGDFVTFGQAVIYPRMNRERNRLLYNTYHLKDTVWSVAYDGIIDTVHRKWHPTITTLMQEFGDKNDPKIAEELGRNDCDPYREVECRHIVIPSENYRSGKKWKTKFVSLYVDVEHEHVIEEVGVKRLGYVIPRWQTISGGWQYAFSPATVIALPDARLIQAMARVILEAGERATFPPLLSSENAIRGDINNYAGGITIVDSRYEGELEKALMPMEQDAHGLSIGLEMQQDTRMMLREAFFLDKLTAPNLGAGPPKTQLEVSQIVSDYIRGATPLFEPMESEYNGALCEETFELIMENGGFGPLQDVPKELRGQNVQFRFVSPLTQALGQDKLGKYQQAGQIIAQAMQIDPGATAEVDARTAMRDTLDGVGIPAKWINTEQQALQIRQKIAHDQQVQAEMAQIQQGAAVADQVGKASQSLTGKLAVPPGASPNLSQAA